MVSAAFFEIPFKLAEIVATVPTVLLLVWTVKVPLSDPAGTVKLAGTVARSELLDKRRREPPAGAGALRTTVAVLAAPL
jgi:hypothetical protein